VRGILTYHSIDGSGSPISVAPEAFARHVRFLASGRVRVVELGKIARVPEEEDAVAITFDDGFANFAERAWPLLRDRGLPATLFVVSDRVGKTNAWDAAPGIEIPSLPLLAWDQLARFALEGLELGAHGRTHASLAGMPRDRLFDEVNGSKEKIRMETGRTPSAFAFPFGDRDAAAVEAVRGAFSCACTTELRALARGEDLHLLPRVDAFYLRSNERLEAWGSAGFRRWLALRGGMRRAAALARRLAPRRSFGKPAARRTMGPQDGHADRHG
jgi:peptidoglycan/xylan/chitin deacetylase (PgdA/CDA1 family)